MRRIAPLLLLLVAGACVWGVMALAPESGPPPIALPAPGRPDADGPERPERRRVVTEPQDAADAIEGGAPVGIDGDAEDEPPTAEVRVLRIVGADGEPLEGVPANAYFFGRTRYTDAAGEVSFRCDVGRTQSVELPALDRRIELCGPLTVETVADVRPVDVRCIDLETGAPLAVTWNDDEGPTQRQRVTWVRPGGAVKVPLNLAPPAGWTLGRAERSRVLGAADVRAGSHVVTLPVAREARVRVQVLRHDGAAAAGVDVCALASMAKGEIEAVGETDGEGRAELRGIRSVRGEWVRVRALLPETTGWISGPRFVAESEPVRLTGASAVFDVTVRLPAAATEVDVFGRDGPGTIGIGGGAGGATDAAPATATLRVSARLAGGAPAAAARLFVRGPVRRTGRTDDAGSAELTELPAGEYDVWLVEGGVVPTRVSVTLTQAQAASVEVVEAPGRTLDVVVVDARGEPLAAARVLATSAAGLPHWSYLHTVDGVQHLPLLTDASGRARLVGLAAEMGTVFVAYGSRGVHTDVGVGPGPIRVTVPDAD